LFHPDHSARIRTESSPALCGMLAPGLEIRVGFRNSVFRMDFRAKVGIDLK
jgi:hypothetical protein